MPKKEYSNCQSSREELGALCHPIGRRHRFKNFFFSICRACWKESQKKKKKLCLSSLTCKAWTCASYGQIMRPSASTHVDTRKHLSSCSHLPNGSVACSTLPQKVASGFARGMKLDLRCGTGMDFRRKGEESPLPREDWVASVLKALLRRVLAEGRGCRKRWNSTGEQTVGDETVRGRQQPLPWNAGRGLRTPQ